VTEVFLLHEFKHDAGLNDDLVFLQIEVTGQPNFSVLRSIVADAEIIGVTAVLFCNKDGALEPLTLLAALAPLTEKIGLVADIDPLQTPPYTAARRLAAIDHASHGRTGWSLRIDIAVDRKSDYVTAVNALWNSWDENVHRYDKTTGVYIDTSGIRAVNHVGPFYRVAGPLDIPRPPQGILMRFGLDAAADVHITKHPDGSGGTVSFAGAVIGELISVTADMALWENARSILAQRLADRTSHAASARTLRQLLGLSVRALNRAAESE
jgi:hypothetical protein